jgi:acyl-CoA thioester hydrolase
MADPLFRYSHRVTYAECTVGNHVYHARYLDCLEAARSAFFRTLGTDFLHWQERGIIFPIVECHLRYRAAARYDDLLTVEVWPAAIAPVRLNFGHRVVNRTGKLILEAETFHACTGLDEKPKRIPAELAEKLAPHLGRAPTG